MKNVRALRKADKLSHKKGDNIESAYQSGKDIGNIENRLELVENRLTVLESGSTRTSTLLEEQTDFYMSPTGSSTPTGSESAPFLWGVDAFNNDALKSALADHDVTVHMQPGIYSESFNLVGCKPEHKLTVQGDPAGGTIFDNEMNWTNCHNMELRNVNFTTEKRITIAFLAENCHNICVENCNFYHMPNMVYGAAAARYGSTNIMFRKCVFFKCGFDSWSHFMYHASRVDPGSTPPVYNIVERIIIDECHFHGCPGEYVKFRGTANECTVKNCTFICDTDSCSMILFTEDSYPDLDQYPASYGLFGTGLKVEYNRVIQAKPGGLVSFWEYVHYKDGNPHKPPEFDELFDSRTLPQRVTDILLAYDHLDVGKIEEQGNRWTFDPSTTDAFDFVMDYGDPNRGEKHLGPLIHHGPGEDQRSPIQITLADLGSSSLFPQWKIIEFTCDKKSCLIEHQGLAGGGGRMLDFGGINDPQPLVMGILYNGQNQYNYYKWHLVQIPGTEQFHIFNVGREEHPIGPDGSKLGYVLALDDLSSTNPKAILALWEDEKEGERRWRIKELPNGFAHIVHSITNKVLGYIQQEP